MHKLLFTLAALLLTTSLLASNYPPSHCAQIAQFKEEGPAIIGTISGPCITKKYVIGYKSSGILGNSNYVYAVIKIIGEHYDNGGTFTTVTTTRLDKEWNGTGFMSIPLNLTAKDGSLSSIEVSFSSKGVWDSKDGENYNFSQYDNQYNNKYRSLSSTGMNIGPDIWNFVIDLMKR